MSDTDRKIALHRKEMDKLEYNLQELCIRAHMLDGIWTVAVRAGNGLLEEKIRNELSDIYDMTFNIRIDMINSIKSIEL